MRLGGPELHDHATPNSRLNGNDIGRAACASSGNSMVPQRRDGAELHGQGRSLQVSWLPEAHVEA